MTWMQTYTGQAFDPVNPHVGQIDILDVAHALSLTCRYGGHSTKFYSVAEHSVLLSHAVSPDNALWALLHDAAEAYMGDMVHPLKVAIPSFSAIENTLMVYICQRFSLSLPMPTEVKIADLRIVLDEKAELLGPEPMPWGAVAGLAPLGVPIAGWYPEQAEAEYLRRFNQLTETKENRNG